jgi:asparagine synthase (glutamine-hydrolysing)
MCGIAGFFRLGFPDTNETLLTRMGESIMHRGPDAGGTYMDQQVGFVHRRLSILDLSEQGNQPMRSACGRYIIVFNGEIYNFLQLRSALEKRGWQFKTRTDTEVILALYAEIGTECLQQMNGMFAFAIWDTQTQVLFLARDRIGKKPLYYFTGGNHEFAFASEIKPLLILPSIRLTLDCTALIDYLKYLYIPAPKTIFKEIYKLPPGHSMALSAGEPPKIDEYWDVKFGNRTAISLETATEELLDLMKSSTALRMIADVPLGAFLSGGIDSSAVVALMAKLSRDPIRTCTIGFNDSEHDETAFAAEISRQFGTNHTEYTVCENLADTVTRLPRHFDEPFADSSAVPTYHVSRLARSSVTVAVAGDGGDECFGGYDKYSTELVENWVRNTLPHRALSLAHSLACRLGSDWMHKVRSLTGSALLDAGRAFYITNTFISDRELKGLLAESIARKCQGYDAAEHTLRYWNRVRDADHVTRMLYTDLKTYLPGDILAKVDRMSMAHSLEVRAPLLDYRIVEFAASLPSRWKINRREKKYILKKSFAQILTRETLHRRKHGFTVPLDAWFRKELRSLTVDSLINNDLMMDFFSRTCLQRVWDEHQNGIHNHGTLLWSLLSFALWHREYLQ